MKPSLLVACCLLTGCVTTPSVNREEREREALLADAHIPCSPKCKRALIRCIEDAQDDAAEAHLRVALVRAGGQMGAAIGGTQEGAASRELDASRHDRIDKRSMSESGLCGIRAEVCLEMCLAGVGEHPGPQEPAATPAAYQAATETADGPEVATAPRSELIPPPRAPLRRRE
jgi:hypothetical protein